MFRDSRQFERLLERLDHLNPNARQACGVGSGLAGIAGILALSHFAGGVLSVGALAVVFVLPVLGASLFGLRPGLITTVAAALLFNYLFQPPVGSLMLSSTSDMVLLSSFTVLAVIVSTLVAALSQARRRYQTLFLAAPTATLHTDEAGRVAAANPAAVTLFALPHDVLLGRSLGVLLGEDGSSDSESWRRVGTGRGSIAVRDVRAPLPDGGEVRMLQDVTAEVEMLEHKERFLVQAAHELRTPVAAQGVLLELLAGDDTLPDAERRETADHALRANRRLEDLVESVLDLQNVRAGRFLLARGTVRLQDAIDEAAQVVDPLLAARGQRIDRCTPSSGSIVVGDRRRLVQVVVNLLGNASRYSPDGGSIPILLVESEREARLEIRNEVLTDSEPADSPRGLGLGLSIARAIVEAHQGVLEVEISRATCVARVRLPLLVDHTP